MAKDDHRQFQEGQAGSADVLLEVCVDNVEGLEAALAGGADRIELCSSLAVGGLTPSAGFMAHAATHSPLPVYGMIRPRAGNFCFSAEEIALMCADIRSARDAGLAGVVIGAARPDLTLDLDALARMVEAAEGMGVTLHRVFDLLADPEAAIEEAISLGIERILTSGGAPCVNEGRDQLQASIDWAAGRIGIMPGGGVTIDNAPLFKAMGMKELHASCSSPCQLAGGATRELALGFVAAGAKKTDRDRVAALKVAINHKG
ncbi:copper homeostasis protein CutC [Cohaesibacter sp. CAU 1516]|uniref:copper homeostasis protein CutC n=1 Tax=Cohaesibacter sp. CAU 1516 TaxID=2576038 RepID=UPI0010FF3AB6|nr:copper homeostasis protein CutC [Cohaesibacter sp. CAU 1516]TLP48257.1 copper homeostasis protein CutC [Cohaesibacter sp. CAU 1516]